MLSIALWHAALPFADGIGFGGQDVTSNEAFGVGAWVTMGFTLRVFLVLAGFFGRFVFERIGLVAFVRARLFRIGVPFLVGVPVVSVVFGYSWLVPYHLWFLEYLFIISVVFALAVPVLRRALVPWRSGIDRLFRAAVRSWWGPLALAIPTAVAVRWMGGWEEMGDVVESPTTTFVPDLVVLSYHAGFYAFGWLLHRNRDVLPALSRNGVAFVVVGIALRGAAAWVKFFSDVPEEIATLAIQLLSAGFTWLMVLGLIGVCERTFVEDAFWLRYVADASFWCYLVHPIPLHWIHLATDQVYAPALLKYAGTVTALLAVLFASYAWFARYSIVGEVLHGPRQRASAGRAARWWRAGADA